MKTATIIRQAVVLAFVVLSISWSSDSKDSNSGTPTPIDRTSFILDGVLIVAD